MKLKRLIGVYDGITIAYLKEELLKNRVRHIINTDNIEGPGGGVIYVHIEDYEKSIEILKNSRVEIADLRSKELPIIERIRSTTKRIPILGNLDFSGRILSIITVLFFIIFILSFISINHISKEELTSDTWCVVEVIENGSTIQLPKISPIIHIEGDCLHKMEFSQNTFKLTSLARGTWQYIGKNEIEIYDKSGSYSGNYKLQMEISDNCIVLKSDKYSIKLKKRSIFESPIIFHFEKPYDLS